MTSPHPSAPTRLRRPPAPSAASATVTRLGSAGGDSLEQTPIASVQGTLALDLRGPTGMPRTPELHLVAGCGGPADELTRWSARFAQAVVEVVGGDRALTQLVRWTSKRVYRDLEWRVLILGRRSGSAERLRTARPQVRSVHVFQPTADSAEVSVRVRHGARSRALAVRLEREEDRWHCTVLRLG